VKAASCIHAGTFAFTARIGAVFAMHVHPGVAFALFRTEAACNGADIERTPRHVLIATGAAQQELARSKS
jgi:hypothetical protein